MPRERWTKRERELTAGVHRLAREDWRLEFQRNLAFYALGLLLGLVRVDVHPASDELVEDAWRALTTLDKAA